MVFLQKRAVLLRVYELDTTEKEAVAIASGDVEVLHIVC
jgi:hypothetical protein